ncbi:MAG: methyltransferase [Oscillospiraceae bacterium]|nr:methyltransferase [Oscillospiraceae bacterium]
MTELREERIGALTLLQDPAEFKLTRDALDLARFATVRRFDWVCDLGCGQGNLLIPLAERAEGLTLDGVELRAGAAALCRENLRRNGLSGTIVTGDLTARHASLGPGQYDLVVANPPYFAASSGAVAPDEARGMARTEGNYTLEAACAAAKLLLHTGGRFALCIRPERLAELMEEMRRHGLEPKRLQLRQPRSERCANLALVEGVRQGRPGLTVLPVLLTQQPGTEDEGQGG